MLDDQTRRMLDRMAESGLKPLHELTIEAARRVSRELSGSNGPGPPLARAYDADADGVSVRVLVPQGSPQGVVVWFHPGLWVVGSPEETETVAAKLAERTTCTWVLPRYRLAPEHQHPAAFDDCDTATRWSARCLGDLAGVDGPLIVGGEGAGATLAAAVARRARDHADPPIAAQLLICPLTDAAAIETSGGTETLLFSCRTVSWALDRYAPDATTRLGPDLSPARVTELSGLPPTLIVIADGDPLANQGNGYAERLRRAGVAVTLRAYAGQMHGFFSLIELRLGERAFQDVVHTVRACCLNRPGRVAARQARTHEEIA